MKHRWSYSVLAAGVSAALLVGSATADDTANMLVQASVAPACQLSAVPTLNFNTLNPLANNDAQTTITWVCTSGVSAAIRLNAGTTSGATIANRMMNGPTTLAYQLYTDAGRTTIFGDGSSGNSAVDVTGAGYGVPQNVIVYGRVLQADAASASGGNYTDTVQVLIDL